MKSNEGNHGAGPGLFDGIVERLTYLPWWLFMVLAVLSYAVLEYYTESPALPAAGPVPQAVILGQYLLPLVFLFAAGLSTLGRLKRSPLSNNAMGAAHEDALLIGTEVLENGTVLRVTMRRGKGPLSFSEVLNLWRGDPDFRTRFNQLLADAPFSAFFWENPPLTRATLDRDFECVLVDSPQLAGVQPDPRTFDDHFPADAGESVVEFPNLGHDAFLIAPCPRGDLEAYPHLAAFTRCAPELQRQRFWERVGQVMADRLSDQPLWLSTSGLGVYWLHVRLDSRPKYYTWRPYKAGLR